MTPNVEVDADLVARASEIAAARGERVEDVIARALREYADTPPIVGAPDYHQH